MALSVITACYFLANEIQFSKQSTTIDQNGIAIGSKTNCNVKMSPDSVSWAHDPHSDDNKNTVIPLFYITAFTVKCADVNCESVQTYSMCRARYSMPSSVLKLNK